MITLNPQTENKLQEIAAQTSQTVQQLIELFILDYQPVGRNKLVRAIARTELCS